MKKDQDNRDSLTPERQSVANSIQHSRQSGVVDIADYVEVVRYILSRKTFILALIAGITTITVVITFSIKPTYRSQVLLAPANSESSQGNLAALAGQFSGLAALAGVNLGSNNKPDEAIAILESRNFTESFIHAEELMPILFEDKWDSDTGKWKSDDVPTGYDAFELFDEDVRSVSLDRRTELVTLNIEWTDRFLAAEWANKLVKTLNDHLRARDIAEAERSIKYLNSELAKSSVVELQQGIFRLIEHQIEAVMLANVREEYAFKVLDSAMPADEDEFVKPKRLLLIVIAVLFGAGLGVFIVLVQFRLQRSQNAEKPKADS